MPPTRCNHTHSSCCGLPTTYTRTAPVDTPFPMARAGSYRMEFHSCVSVFRTAPVEFGVIIALHAASWAMAQLGAPQPPYLLCDYPATMSRVSIAKRCAGFITDAVQRAEQSAAALSPTGAACVGGTASFHSVAQRELCRHVLFLLSSLSFEAMS